MNNEIGSRGLRTTLNPEFSGRAVMGMTALVHGVLFI